MFSVKARSKMLERGRNFSSLARFFGDSLRESIENIRIHRTLSASILKFSAFFHAIVLVSLYPLYHEDDRSLYARLLLFTFCSALGFTAWILLYVGIVRDKRGTMHRTLGPANKLTLARFFLIVPAVVLFSHGHVTAALVVYVVLGLTDVADGLVARRRNEWTEFGVVMDPLADVFSTAAVFAVFLDRGLVPAWLFGILMVRYVMLIAGSFVLFLVVGPMEFRATLPGKIVGVLQAVGIIIVLVCFGAGIDLEKAIGPVLFPFLGFIFFVIVVSQAVIGYRHCKRYGRIRNKAVRVGS